MTIDKAKQYLINVLLKWDAFNAEHPKMKESITVLLLENERLKNELKLLRNNENN